MLTDLHLKKFLTEFAENAEEKLPTLETRLLVTDKHWMMPFGAVCEQLIKVFKAKNRPE